jgi:hypothetical protein
VNGETATIQAPRWRLHLPDPGRGWVRYAPALWPAAESWIDVPGERWGAGAGRGSFPAEPEPPAADVVWLPPVPAHRAVERDAWAGERAREGAPVVAQLLPGERAPAGCIAAFDLSEVVLGARQVGREDFSGGDARSAIALWPVLPGIELATTARATVLDALAAAGLRTLLVVRPELRPADLRFLASRVSEERYAGVFHGRPGSRRAIAREARVRGLEPFPPRPPLGVADPHGVNRRVAEVFGLLGELWSRLGMAAEPGQAFFSAMRAADRLPQSLARLQEEGNLGVLPWLDASRRRVVEDVLATGTSPLLDDLLERYAGAASR